jgi:hypothetical protein
MSPYAAKSELVGPGFALGIREQQKHDCVLTKEHSSSD